MKIIKGALILMKGEKVAENLYQMKGEIMQEAEASVVSHSPSHKAIITWHQKLGHMSEQGMKILVEKNLLPGFTKQKGIKRHFTMSYTPQQNGVAERMNRTLLERARAMLATASLEKSFWVEAVNTACYVINRSPSTTVELKTSMEMWKGKPVNYSDFHIFGSPVYVMYNTQETTKLDPKSRKCLFLGYANRVKGYHLWDLTAHKVVVSRDVVFIEDKI
ncbi:gag-pol polyprotein [Tanacetum coccineum]|uniref:Gag-pol polyprotein n=1 Tax=Tanacetum coccineum TaxID=301880 RepID=A0ABQ5A7I7_9ASTR